MASASSLNEQSPFERIGGRDTLQLIVDRFYDLMDSDPAYARLRKMHAADLSHMRSSLTGFLVGWAGGPRDWFDANPGKCMMSVHTPFTIDRDLADQWTKAMQRAISEVAPADKEVADALANTLGQIAHSMAAT